MGRYSITRDGVHVDEPEWVDADIALDAVGLGAVGLGAPLVVSVSDDDGISRAHCIFANDHVVVAELVG